MKKMKWTTWIRYGFLLTAFVGLCVFQNMYMDASLSSDDASELVLSNLLAKNGGILSTDWYYSTEIRVLNAQIIWSFLFRFISDWHVVHLLGNAIMFVILLICLWSLCKAFELQTAFPVLGAILLLPVSDLYYAFVLQNVCYIPYIATIFIMFAGVVYFVNKFQRVQSRIVLVGVVILSILNGMGGARQLLTFYLPFAIAVFIYYVWFADDAIRNRNNMLLYMGIVTLSAMIGYVVNSRILRQRFLFGQYEHIAYTPFSWDRVIHVMNGWLNALGYKSGGSVFSISTLFNATAGITIILIGYSIVCILKNRQYAWPIRLFALYYVAAFAAYLLLYSFTNMDYSDRYNLPITACSYVLIFACFLANPNANKQRTYSIWVGLLVFTVFLVGCGFFNYYPRIRSFAGNPRKEAAVAIAEQGYTTGYATFWNANITTELANGRLDMLAWTAYPGDVTILDELPHWLTKASHEVDVQGKIFVLLSSEEAEQFSFVQRIDENQVIYKSDAFIAYGFSNKEELRTIIEK